MEKPWYIGNTTVRNPYRLKEGLQAIARSPLQGNMRNTAGDSALTNLLANNGLISLREDMPDSTNSVGRKWRAALEQMGFLYPKAKRGQDQKKIGAIDFITPNGERLITSESVAGDQECYLRALAGQSKTVRLLNGEICRFNPLRHVLALMRQVDEMTGSPSLNAIELSLFAFSTVPEESYQKTAADLLDLRARRSAAKSKKRFDSEEYLRCAKLIGVKKPHTFKDYLDANMRYLKATGLLQSKGNGLSIVPEKESIAYAIIDFDHPEWGSEEAVASQCSGVKLPTDDALTALSILNNEVAELRKYGVECRANVTEHDDIKDIQQARYNIEEKLGAVKEERYALEQRNCWVEIHRYLSMLSKGTYSYKIDDENELVIPRSEAAAYLEWSIWRAFLAMDSMVSKPFDARRFKVDQDFLPLSTAPGNGPDLIFEFEDCLLVVEVTLTESSRQEAAEGEPVRRHVADIVQEHPEKNVFGLFIANKIDSNTAETFRIGSWYDKDDNKSKLTIVPVTTKSFNSLFEAVFESGTCNPSPIKKIIKLCDEAKTGVDAPQWKNEIERIVEKEATHLCA